MKIPENTLIFAAVSKKFYHSKKDENNPNRNRKRSHGRVNNTYFRRLKKAKYSLLLRIYFEQCAFAGQKKRKKTATLNEFNSWKELCDVIKSIWCNMVITALVIGPSIIEYIISVGKELIIYSIFFLLFFKVCGSKRRS